MVNHAARIAAAAVWGLARGFTAAGLGIVMGIPIGFFVGMSAFEGDGEGVATFGIGAGVGGLFGLVFGIIAFYSGEPPGIMIAFITAGVVIGALVVWGVMTIWFSIGGAIVGGVRAARMQKFLSESSEGEVEYRVFVWGLWAAAPGAAAGGALALWLNSPSLPDGHRAWPVGAFWLIAGAVIGGAAFSLAWCLVAIVYHAIDYAVNETSSGLPASGGLPIITAWRSPTTGACSAGCPRCGSWNEVAALGADAACRDCGGRFALNPFLIDADRETDEVQPPRGTTQLASRR